MCFLCASMLSTGYLNPLAEVLKDVNQILQNCVTESIGLHVGLSSPRTLQGPVRCSIDACMFSGHSLRQVYHLTGITHGMRTAMGRPFSTNIFRGRFQTSRYIFVCCAQDRTLKQIKNRTCWSWCRWGQAHSKLAEHVGMEIVSSGRNNPNNDDGAPCLYQTDSCVWMCVCVCVCDTWHCPS